MDTNKRATILNEMCFDESLVVLNIDAETNKEAIGIVAQAMLREGMVKESYPQAVLARERIYPTGLALIDMGVAMPHTDPEHVLRPALALGILNKPVKFVCMGEPDKTVDVEVVIMLSILEPHAQLLIFQKLLKVFQEVGKLQKLKECKTQKEAADCLTALLND